MKQSRFDIVHAWTGTANFYARVPAIMAGVPCILGGLRGRRTVNKKNRWVYSFTNWRCNGWIVNADDIKRIAEGHLRFRRNSPIYVVPNGIEIGDDSRLKKDRHGYYDDYRKDRPVVGTVGRLAPVKNHKMFLKVARLLRNRGVEADFWLIGEGPMWAELEAYIQENELEGIVTMFGNRTDVDEGLSRMDILLLTSDSEGCPNVLLEAMRAGLPCISTNCSSLDEIIEDGLNGRKVPVGNAEAMADQVEILLKDEQARTEMGNESRRIVEQRFAMQIAVNRMQNVYLECLKRANSE